MTITNLDQLVGEQILLFKAIGQFQEGIPICIGRHELLFAKHGYNSYYLKYLTFHCCWDDGERCTVRKIDNVYHFVTENEEISLAVAATLKNSEFNTQTFTILLPLRININFKDSLIYDEASEMKNLLIYRPIEFDNVCTDFLK